MPKQDYTEAERVGTMALALERSVATVSEQVKIPERTIYEWFEQAGGIAEVRAFTDAARGKALSEASRVLCDEVAKRGRAGDLPTDELMTTFREMLRSEADTHGGSEAAAGAQAGATAIGALHVHVDGEEIIVPREDHE